MLDIKVISDRDKFKIAKKICDFQNSSKDKFQGSHMLHDSFNNEFVCFIYFQKSGVSSQPSSQGETPDTPKFKLKKETLQKWAKEKPTKKMIWRLEQMKISKEKINQMSRLEAHKLIEENQ